MSKFIISIFVILSSFTAHGIVYVKGSAKISAEEFDKCDERVFRKTSQDELSPENRRTAVKESLTGKSINDLGSLKKFLTDHPDACSYISDQEKLK